MAYDSHYFKNLTKHVLKGRYFMTFSTLIILSFAGTSHLFGMYSNSLKSLLGYDQTTLNLLGFFKNLGTYIGIHAGLIMEVTPPSVVLILGASMNFFGYFMVWLAVTHKIPTPPVWQMCLYICIGANTLGFVNTGALVTCVKNFPSNRGIVIGVLTGYLGLGGAIMNQLYHALYDNRESGSSAGIILMISWLPTGVILAFTYNIRAIKVDEIQSKRDTQFFYFIFFMSLTLALFLMVIIIVQNEVRFTKRELVGTAIATAILLILPLMLVVKEEHANNLDEANTISSSSAVNSVIMSKEPHRKMHFMQEAFKPPPVGEDHTILQATFRLEMQILFLATICGIGGQVTMIDNLGQIGTTLGYPKSSIATAVSLVSIWQYLGRVLVGLLSDQLLAKYRYPRSMSLTLILLLSSIGHLLIAFNIPYGLYVASIIIGFCLGAQFTLLFAIISELFGLKHYATLCHYSAVGTPLGSYIFNVKIVGKLYDKEGMRQLQALGLHRKSGKLLNCDGPTCFRLAFFILAAGTLFSTFASLILVARTWKSYRNFQENLTTNDENN